MSRKKPVFKPDFLSVTMAGEGEVLLTMRAPAPINVTARSFEALVRVHPNARRSAIAVTLIEIARSLLASPSYETELLSQVVSSLILDELPMQDFSVPDDFPF